MWDQEIWNQVFADAEEKLLQDPDFLGELGNVGSDDKRGDWAKGEYEMLARKPIQDISVIDVTGDIDFREMIRIKEAIGGLMEKDRIKGGA